jgi:hypothetical protein
LVPGGWARSGVKDASGGVHAAVVRPVRDRRGSRRSRGILAALERLPLADRPVDHHLCLVVAPPATPRDSIPRQMADRPVTHSRISGRIPLRPRCGIRDGAGSRIARSLIPVSLVVLPPATVPHCSGQGSRIAPSPTTFLWTYSLRLSCGIHQLAISTDAGRTVWTSLVDHSGKRGVAMHYGWWGAVWFWFWLSAARWWMIPYRPQPPVMGAEVTEGRWIAYCGSAD